MNEMKESITTIQVSRENRDRLAAFGLAGESLNDALSHVLDLAEVRASDNFIEKLMKMDSIEEAYQAMRHYTAP